MSMIGHILKKDTRRLRAPLMIWAALVAVALVLLGAQTRSPLPELGMCMTGVYFFQRAFILLLIPMLIQADPSTGGAEFWISRPISKLEMLASKIAFIGLFLVLLPLIGTIPLLAMAGTPLAEITQTSLQTGVHFARWLLLLTLLAALTRGVVAFLLTAGLYLLISIGLSLVATLVPACTDMNKILVVAASLAIISIAGILLYKSRRRTAPIALLALNLIFFSLFGAVWPWTPTAHMSAAVTTLKPETITIEYQRHNYAADRVRSKEVMGPLEFLGLPDRCFAKIRKISAEFSTDETSILRSAFRDVCAYEFRDNNAALTQVVAPREFEYHSPTYMKLLNLTLEEHEQLEGIPGHYRADITFDVFRYETIAKLPLEIGAKVRVEGEGLVVGNVAVEEYGCRVILPSDAPEGVFESARDKRVHIFLNNIRKRACAPSQLIIPGNPPYGGSFDSVAIINGSLMCIRPTKNMLFEYCDPDRAELLIIEPRFVGTFVKHLDDPWFVIGRPDDKVRHGSQASDNAQILSKLSLPVNATRGQVYNYIHKINAMSATQEFFYPDDPQVDMMAALGTNYINQLIWSIPNNHHYNFWAVKKKAGAGEIQDFMNDPSRFNRYNIWAISRIIQPEHKPAILRMLYLHPLLVELVVQQGWEKDARKNLLEDLKSKSDLPPRWIQAVASFKDPDTYDLLTRYFIEGNSKKTTYDSIKHLPGFDLDLAVSRAWHRAMQFGGYSINYDFLCLSIIALEHGHVDALAAAAESLVDPETKPWLKTRIRKAVCKHTGQAGTDRELWDWYLTNKDRLQFDAETKLFVVE